MYALIKDGTVSKYPYSVYEFRQDNRTVSLPAEPTIVQLEEVGLYQVAVATKPSPIAGEVVEESTPVLSNGVWTQTWSVRNGTPEELAIVQADILSAIVEATQARLDAFARTRNYDGILSLCTYATSPTPKFAIEGQCGVEARDATWAKLYDILAEVQAGTRPMPTGFADVEPELPPLVWSS